MFKDARRFFLYLAWFVGLVTALFSSINLADGILAATTGRGLFYDVPIDVAVRDVPPALRDAVLDPEKYVALDPEEREELFERYEAATKDAEERSKEQARYMGIRNVVRSATGILLGLLIALFTWKAAANTHPTEEGTL